MSDSYNAADISAADLEAVMQRLRRYLLRHGSPSGETPIPADQFDDVQQSILVEWMADDWTARELESLARNGRTLFGPTLSDLGRHLRGMLFHAGRARKRCWRAEGATQRVADRRRDPEGFRGIGAGSVSADPARIVAAVESVSGELVLSVAAAAARSARGLPLRVRPGVSAVPDDAPTTFRAMKRRNVRGWTIDVVERLEDRTRIEIRRWVEYRFQRVGKVPHRVSDNAHYVPTLGIRRVIRSKPNPAIQPVRKKLPKGIGAADVREAVGIE
jgi:hypothetical protein